MPDVAPQITIQDAYLAYKNTILFDQLNLELKAGKFTSLLGPSGVGKTTLLRMIAHLIPEGNSEDQVFHAKISTSTDESIQEQMAYLAQQDSLLPWLTALDNCLLGARLRGELNTQQREKARHLLEEVDLRNVEKKYPSQLSGGMRQRVALVRTLLEDKPIVLMDEPFSALDAITRFELQTLAVHLLKNKTVLLITHDPIEALRMSDEIYVLSGQPAQLQLAVSLESPAPRNPADSEFMRYQALLFDMLTKAKKL